MEAFPVDLIVRVTEIKGTCPVYEIGDSIVMRDGYILDTEDSDEVCMHSLASLMPYHIALSRGISPESLGLSGPKQGAWPTSSVWPPASLPVGERFSLRLPRWIKPGINRYTDSVDIYLYSCSTSRY